MQILRFFQHSIWIPRLLLIAKVIAVIFGLASEFARDEVVRPVGKDQSPVLVQFVDDFHVVIATPSGLHGLQHPREFVRGRLHEHELGAQDSLVEAEPVGAGHCDARGGQEEKIVHALEDGGVGVEVEDSLVLRLVEC